MLLPCRKQLIPDSEYLMLNGPPQWIFSGVKPIPFSSLYLAPECHGSRMKYPSALVDCTGNKILPVFPGIFRAVPPCNNLVRVEMGECKPD
jgi:hypothetical protein